MGNINRAALTEGPVGRTLFRLTVPMLIGIAGMVAFNLTDTIFIGRFGTLELAALSFTFPVVLVFNRLALGIGDGASALISQAIGRGDERAVRRYTTDSLTLALAISAVFITAGYLTIEQLFRAIGADQRILPLVRSYMTVWYLGMIFVNVPMVGNNAIRATGDTKTPALIMLAAVTVNIVLDPLLIFGIGPFPRLGLRGAAIATVIARSTSMMISLYVLCLRDRMVTCAAVPFRDLLRSWGRVLYIGVPSAATKIIVPIGIGVITGIVSSFGAEAVAGFGVSSRIEFFAMASVMALATVLGPFVGQNRGAGRQERMERGVRYSSLFALVWGLGMWILLATAARPIASLFTRDESVIAASMAYLRIVPAAYCLQGVFILSTSTLNVLHRPLHAAALGIGQTFAICIPLAYAGSRIFALNGAFSAIVISYILAGIISYWILNKILVRERGMDHTGDRSNS